jgi:hypothetical protein
MKPQTVPLRQWGDDIRMVYDSTRSGLNDAMWAPWFPLPTIEAHLRFVDNGTHMGDIDIGDMFLNFMLHDDVRMVAGVDLTPFSPEELDDQGQVNVIWERWTRCGMGFKSSPYNTIQGILMAEEIVRGDHRDANNILRWDTVLLNLPGSISYQPGKPWVMKIRSPDGKMACDFIIYVDDIRTAGNDWWEGRLAARRVASTMHWLGIQDAARKRRDPSETPGPWAGSIIHSDGGAISITVSQER